MDQAHLLILDHAVDLSLFSHIPEPENFIRDGVVVSLLIGLLHELLLQLPEALMVPIPGTTKTERVKENFDAVEIDLTGEEMQEIETALAGMDIVGMGR